jgi:hypothetical protein
VIFKSFATAKAFDSTIEPDNLTAVTLFFLCSLQEKNGGNDGMIAKQGKWLIKDNSDENKRHSPVWSSSAWQ